MPADILSIILAGLVITIFFVVFVLKTFEIIAGIIKGGVFFLDYVLRKPLVYITHRVGPLSNADEAIYKCQCVVGGGFFCWFVYQIEKQPGLVVSQSPQIAGEDQAYTWLTFPFLVILLIIVVQFELWWTKRKFPNNPAPRLRERVLTPTWRWLAEQSYALLWLERVQIFRPVIEALKDASNQIRNRRWRIFLEFLFCLSVFTIPVRLVLDLDQTLAKAAEFLFDKLLSIFHVGSPVGTLIGEHPILTLPITTIGAIYLYFFDWIVTIFVIYIVVVVLSELVGRRDVFESVQDALEFFGSRARYGFSGYFWFNRSSGRFDCASYSASDTAWEGVAADIHRQTAELDKHLRSSNQGENVRVAIILEEKWATGRSYCIHYQRLGSSAFIVVVDDRERKFARSNESQIEFRRLVESVGNLVNVRESLK